MNRCNCLDKLPETQKYLATACENIDQFRVRKIIWAIKKLTLTETDIKEWKVKLLAGLFHLKSSRINQITLSCILHLIALHSFIVPKLHCVRQIGYGSDQIDVTCDCIAAHFNGKIYLFSGISDDGEIFEEYDIATDTWKMLPPLSEEWFGAGIAILDGRMFVFPDFYNSEPGVEGNIKEYNPKKMNGLIRQKFVLGKKHLLILQ